MKKVMIVDDEASLLRSIEAGFENHHERFQMLTAANGREALAVLESQAIDLVITDLRMPVMDGFELLAEMSLRFPHIPNVVMSAFGTPRIEKQLASLGTFRFLDKPVDFDTMDQCINSALDAIDDEAGSFSGISLASFLQLIEVEGKTCTLFVFSKNHHRGVLHFQSGRLINASSGGLTGNQAVIEMVTWEDVKLSLHELTLEPNESVINITSDLMSLLMEGAHLKDETEAELEAQIEEGLDLKIGESESVAGFHLHPEAENMAGLDEIHKDMANEIDVASAIQMPEDETEAKLEAQIEQGLDLKFMKSESVADFNLNSDGGNMAGLKEILKDMASEMDGVLAIGVIGMDGIPIAVHNPAGADTDAFSAKFAMVMKLIEKSIGDLKNLGDFEENLVQTQNAWVLTRFVGAGYYVGIAVSREGTLGNVRLVAGKYQERLRKSL